MHVLVPKNESINVSYVLALLNSKLLNWYYHSLNPEIGEALAEVKKSNVAALPIKLIDGSTEQEVTLGREVIEAVGRMLPACRQYAALPNALRRRILHSHRTPCSLGHYLQPDYASALTAEILIDDVMQKGFLHGLGIETDNGALVLRAQVSATAKGEPETFPVLRLRFAHTALRQFVYACWQQFLADHARRKKWTTGKQPEEIYRRIVNTEEPLVFFHAGAADNLRAITVLLEAVAAEAGVSDLAALEAEIAATDEEIDRLVYDLYELTPEEIALVERS